MKKIMVCFVLMVSIINAEAQTIKAKKKAAVKTTAAKLAKTPKKPVVTVLNTTSSNQAYQASSVARLQISDSTINAMNQKATGAAIRLNSSAITGMPKGTYGFANGKIWLRSTTATTSGTSYGSGSVGTGTSIMSTGTSEATIGVNGKSPDAGVGLWGDRRPSYALPLTDTLKKQ